MNNKNTQMVLEKARYMHSCINCGGEIGDDRLFLGLPCRKCIPTIPDKTDIESIYIILKERGVLKKRFEEIYKIDRYTREFIEFFRIIMDNPPWSAQRTWAKRVFKAESFSILAPTGVGKTLFGMVMSLYISGVKKWGKSYILVPTTTLVDQITERLRKYAEKAALKTRIVGYHSHIEDRTEMIKKISNNEYDILITTNQFLSSRYDQLKETTFKFIFVDDVDAIIRRSKNIDKILSLIGVHEDTIKHAMEAIKLKIKLPTLGENERKKALEQLVKLNRKIKRAKRGIKGILVVSTATGRPRGLKVKLFREILDFQVGMRSEVIRNIVDLYKYPDERSLDDILVDLVKKLGVGGLIYIPVDKGIGYAYSLLERMKQHGIRVGVVSAEDKTALRRFQENELDVLIGVAIYYGVMVRGIDIPEKIRYAIFVGVPRFRFSTDLEAPTPLHMTRILPIIKEAGLGDPNLVENYMKILNRLLQKASYARLIQATEILKGEREAVTRFEKKLIEIRNYIYECLNKPDAYQKISGLKHVDIEVEGDRFYILIPDVMTYIQASGRTSRLYAGGITKGLSVIIVDHKKLLEGLITRMRWIVEDSEWMDYDKADIDKIISEVNRDRDRVRLVKAGKITTEFEDPVKTKLMIVESPNKARTIAGFFGKPTIRRRDKNIVYEVSIGNLILMITASGGHVYDLVTLPRKYELDNGLLYGVYITNGKYIPLYNSIKRCLRCGHQYTSDQKKCPKCGGDKIYDSISRVEFIRELATEVDEVLIATDPDVEGEKIGWDVAILIRPYTRRINRLEFHEITKKAIIYALENPREFIKEYVEAQIVRRIEDRWIGFLLSGKLRTELRMIIGDKKWFRWRKGEWSAGRVQTPVLGWVIKRWGEVERSVKNIYEVKLPHNIELEVDKNQVGEIGSDEEFVIETTKFYEDNVNPPPPYTTDALLLDSSRYLRLGADETMRIAQELFEMGLITYHRTDSTRVSDKGMQIAKEYLSTLYDNVDEVYRPRRWGQEGAHECIRPTRPIDAETLIELVNQGDLTLYIPLTRNHIRLYSMIFRRFMASQMKPATIKKQKIIVILRNIKLHEEERVVEIIDEGFNRIYSLINTKDKILNRLIVKPSSIRLREKPTIYGYTQGDIIRTMKEKGIGRPSTYAKIVSTLLKRRYVFESRGLRWLIPSEKGKIVYSYLIDKYPGMVSEERTRFLEDRLRKIEEGILSYLEVLNELYNEIEDKLEPVEEAYIEEYRPDIYIEEGEHEE